MLYVAHIQHLLFDANRVSQDAPLGTGKLELSREGMPDEELQSPVPDIFFDILIILIF